MKYLLESKFLIFHFKTFLFLLLSINPFLVYPYNSLLYNEIEPGLKLDKVLTFKDKTTIISLVKPINESCVEPQINLRILHPNGTIDAAIVDFPIPESNFCYRPNGNNYWFDLERSFPESLYILYINSTDITSASYYVLLVTRTGKFISNTYIAPASIINGNIYANGYITPHISEEHGFIFSNYESETIVTWNYFSKPDDKGNIYQINNGKFYLQNPFSRYWLFYGIDGNFGFITMNTTDTKIKSNKSIDPSEFTVKVYVSFIRPIMNGVNGPFLIYQSSIPHISVDVNCDAAYTSTGNFCILLINRVNPKMKQEPYLLKLSFQNSGSVSTIEKFELSELKVDVDIDDIKFYHIYNLFDGRHLIVLLLNTEDKYHKIIKGILLDRNKKYLGTWDFPEDLRISDNYILAGFRDGTNLLVTKEDEMSWRILSSTTLPNTLNDYENPKINSTYPLINSNIPLSITNINITYNLPVDISTNNISIYQYSNDNNPPILRQYITGNSQYFSSSPDNKIINIKVLESTFNQPNSYYYVVINDNLVKDRMTNQTLIVVESWKFSTANNQDIFADQAIGKFSLTAEGTKIFEGLSSNDQLEFLSRLKVDLAKSIPVDINRLDNIKCCEYENDKILLSLPIKSTTNLNNRNVDRIMKDLNLLIQNKEITPISWFGTTNLIDASFGFQRTWNFLDGFKFHLIGIVISGLLYFYERNKRNPMMGKNIVIFKFSLIILDFIMGITFILNNGKKIPQLFIPSILFCVLPTITNFLISIVIILQEIKQNKYFYEWFKNNTNITALFTILAGADPEILSILSSQIAGITTFNAPISNKTQSYIFWANILGFFIKDIPQFIIQILYTNLTISYDIIPILTLLTSSTVLANNIISKMYHVIIQLRKKRKMSNSIPSHSKVK
ncbi:hypothetical protein C1645_878851 [Glomus cerebriforme]|uniref:Uncharacterized protein n=1 Tax=Glomus cerebriforme TaxID=658196 RepID=A0A397STF8_9GLOM|nr:hypothetical protein C1645_878851 [Glomus cerebriforme]